MKFFMQLLALLLATSATNSSWAARLLPIEIDASMQASPGLTVEVQSENSSPIAGAMVWIEDLNNRPLSRGVTDSQGKISVEIARVALDQGVVVTAWAKGYTAVTHLKNVTPGLKLILPQLPSDEYAELRGTIRGFGEMDSSSRVTVGLVAKAIQLADLTSLDTSAFVSPMKDEIDVFGPRLVPSNLVLPEQTIPVFIFPVELNKPNYRLPMIAGSSNKYFGASATAPVNKATDAVKNNEMWDLINLMKIQKVGLTSALTAPKRGEVLEQVIDLNRAVSETISVKVAKNASVVPKGSRRLVGTLWEPESGLFVPTDIKQVEEGTMKLTAAEVRRSRVLDIYLEESGARFRGAWMQGTQVAKVSLTASLSMESIDTPWNLQGVPDANWVVARVEESATRSVGGDRYVDRWLLVGPRNAKVALPAYAYSDLKDEMKNWTHASADLMRINNQGYPFWSEANGISDLQSLEKVRQKRQKHQMWM